MAVSVTPASSASSVSRPMSGARLCRSRWPGGATARTAMDAWTGRRLPLASTGSMSAYSKESRVAMRVSGPTTTVPGSAASWSRLAVFTTSPMAVYSRPARTVPTSTSPVLMPTRMRTGTPPSAAMPAMVCCMRSPARTARSASSSWATGAPNSATMASPTTLSTRPPKSSMSSARRSKHRSTRAFTCSGSSSSERAVNPTRSAKRTVAMRRWSPTITSSCPHEEQKRAPAGTSARHWGHCTLAVYGRRGPDPAGHLPRTVSGMSTCPRSAGVAVPPGD